MKKIYIKHCNTFFMSFGPDCRKKNASLPSALGKNK